MAFDYAGFLEIAQRLLAEFGRSVTFRTTEFVFDPRTGETTPAETNITVTMVTTPVEYERIAQGLAKAGDTMGMVAGALTFDSNKQQTIVMDSEIWDVVDHEFVRPAGTVILTRLHLRRSK